MEKHEISELQNFARDLEIKGSKMATAALTGGNDMRVAYASGASAAYLDSASRIRRILEIVADPDPDPDLEKNVP